MQTAGYLRPGAASIPCDLPTAYRLMRVERPYASSPSIDRPPAHAASLPSEHFGAFRDHVSLVHCDCCQDGMGLLRRVDACDAADGEVLLFKLLSVNFPGSGTPHANDIDRTVSDVVLQASISLLPRDDHSLV